MDEGFSNSFRRVYSAGWRKYLSFVEAFSLEAYPIDNEKVTLFVAFLGVQGLSISTIESHLSALRHFHLLANPNSSSPSFHSPFMSLLLCSIKRANLYRQRVVRLPITIILMGKIKAVLAAHPDSYLHTLLWAACYTGFFWLSSLRGISYP